MKEEKSPWVSFLKLFCRFIKNAHVVENDFQKPAFQLSPAAVAGSCVQTWPHALR